MALSFADSLQSNKATTQSEPVVQPKTMAVNEPENEDYPIAMASFANEPSVMALDAEEEQWILSEAYAYYPEYEDTEYSSVSKDKSITVNSSQINITQEQNSQFIPFKMNRYYDGYDLMNATIMFHYVNKNNDEDYANPVNVYFNDKQISFAWLVDEKVTAIQGKVRFEIQAVGVNSKNEIYIWKTKPNGELNILESLSGNGVIEPDSDWIDGFFERVAASVAEAQTVKEQASQVLTEVNKVKNDISAMQDDIDSIVDTAKNELREEIETAIEENVTGKLDDYYTKTETDDEIAENILLGLSDYYTKTKVNDLLDTLALNLDVSVQMDDLYRMITEIDGLKDFSVEYDGNEMKFYNGEELIKSIEITSDPTEEWTTSYTQAVDTKISTAKAEAISELESYKTTTDADLSAIHESIDGLPETLSTDYYTKTATDEKFATVEDLETEIGTVTSAIGSINTSIGAVESSVETNRTNVTTLGNKLGDLEEAINSIDKSPRLSYEATYDEEYTYTLWEIQGEGDDEQRTPKSQFKIQGGSGGGGQTTSVLKIEYVTKSPLVVTVNDKAIIQYKFSGVDSSGDEVTDGVATWRVGSTVVASSTAVSGVNTFDITDFLSIGTQKVTLSITDDAGSLVTKSWTIQKIDVRLESSFNDTLTYPLGSISFDYTPYGSISKTVHFVIDGHEVGTVNTGASGIPMGYNLPAQPHGSHLVEAYMTADINGSEIESNKIVKDVIWYDATSDVPVIGCIQQNFTARQYDTTNISYTVYDPSTETPSVQLAVDGNVISTQRLESNTNVWQFKSTEVGNHVLTITCGETVKTLNVVIEKLDIELEPVTAGLVFDFNPSGKSNNDVDRLWSYNDVHMTVSENFDWVNGGYQIDDNGDQYFCIKAGTRADIDYKLFCDENDAKRSGKEFKLVFKSTNVERADAQFLSCVDGTDSKIGIEMNVHEAYIHASANSLYCPYSEDDIIEWEFNINKRENAIPMVMSYEDGVASRPMVYDDTYSFSQLNQKTITLGSDYCDLHIYRFKVYNTELSDKGILNNFIADARNAEEMIARYNRNQIYDENQQLTPEILAERCPQLRIIKVDAPHFTNNKSDKVDYTTIQMIYKGGDPVLDNWTAYNCRHSGQGTTSNEYGAAGRNLDLIMNVDETVDGNPYKSDIVLGDGTHVEKVSLTRNSQDASYFNVKVNIASSENANNALLQRRYNQFNPYLRPARLNNPKVNDTMEFYNCVVFVRENDEDIDSHREFNDTNWHFYAIGNVGDSKKNDKNKLNDKNDHKECIIEIMDNTLPNSAFPSGDQALADLEADEFGEKQTYGFRYKHKECTDEETEELKTAWKDFYKFVINSTDEDFKANLKDWFVVDSALFFYLYTTRYTMVDNRAKNTFWHRGKCEDGVYRWDLCFDYDNDTALGIKC